jgi:hypothetical protein
MKPIKHFAISHFIVIELWVNGEAVLGWRYKVYDYRQEWHTFFGTWQDCMDFVSAALRDIGPS